MTEPILSQPLIDRNIVFIGEGLHDATRSRVVALELPSGTPIWQQSFPSHIESALALSADRNIVFGCAGEAGAFALKSSDGSILWRNTLGHCDTTPWIESDTLFLVASSPLQPESSLLWALRASDGSPLWSLPIPGQPWGTPAIDQATSHLVVTSGRGQLDLPIQSGEVGWAHAVDVANRKLRWSRHLDGMPLLNHLLLTLGERSLGVFTLKKGRIIALDLSDGKEIWSLDLKFPILSSPRLLPPQMNAVPEHGLLALDFNGMLYTINGGTGQISSRRPLGTESTSSPAFSSSKVFFGTRGAIFGWSP